MITGKHHSPLTTTLGSTSLVHLMPWLASFELAATTQTWFMRWSIPDSWAAPVALSFLPLLAAISAQLIPESRCCIVQIISIVMSQLCCHFILNCTAVFLSPCRMHEFSKQELFPVFTLLAHLTEIAGIFFPCKDEVCDMKLSRRMNPAACGATASLL